jgi:hypothetical protein
MTVADDVLAKAVELLGPWAEETNAPEEGRMDVVLRPENLLAAVGALGKEQWGHLTSITGLDLGVDAGEIEILYHFRRETQPLCPASVISFPQPALWSARWQRCWA